MVAEEPPPPSPAPGEGFSLPALQGYSLVLAWLWCHLAFQGIDLN